MSRRVLNLVSFFDPQFADPNALEHGTVPWLLANYRSVLFPGWLLKGWRGEKRFGRPAWPAIVLMTFMLLRWDDKGMSRRAAVRQASKNVTWRAALGLQIGAPTFDEKTVREFEKFLCQPHPDFNVPRFMVFHEHVVRLNLEAGVLGDSPIWSTDSTPMYAYGATLDTVRLLGDGLGMLARQWAKARKLDIEELATAWKLPFIVAKSTKGAFEADWSDSDARAKVITELAHKAIDCCERVRAEIGSVRNSKRKGLLRRCRNLLKVVSDDLETDKQGRLVVAQRVAKERLISLTDPESRHGRKSKGRTFNGYKVHGVGDVISNLIVSLTVTKGNAHDGSVCHRLIKRAKKLKEDIVKVLGDTAYGGARLRNEVKEDFGVELLAPPPASGSSKSERFGKQDFDVSPGMKSATCPGGIRSVERKKVSTSRYDEQVWRFRWPKEACRQCPLKAQCNNKTRVGHYVDFHPYEEELREARVQWSRPEVREEYRSRSECERLMNLMVRQDRRQVRAFGLKAANLQAHLVVAASNLSILAKQLAKSGNEVSSIAA